MAESLVVRREGNQVTVTGFINEDSDLSEVFSGSSQLTLDLSGVSRINSCGVREWMNALREAGGNSITFTHCSTAIVEQFNMIADFSGHGKIESFFSPYFCKSCEKSVMKLLTVAEHGEACSEGEAPEFDCDDCSEALAFDEDEEEYFMFLEGDD